MNPLFLSFFYIYFWGILSGTMASTVIQTGNLINPPFEAGGRPVAGGRMDQLPRFFNNMRSNKQRLDNFLQQKCPYNTTLQTKAREALANMETRFSRNQRLNDYLLDPSDAGLSIQCMCGKNKCTFRPRNITRENFPPEKRREIVEIQLENGREVLFQRCFEWYTYNNPQPGSTLLGFSTHCLQHCPIAKITAINSYITKHFHLQRKQWYLDQLSNPLYLTVVFVIINSLFPLDDLSGFRASFLGIQETDQNQHIGEENPGNPNSNPERFIATCGIREFVFVITYILLALRVPVE